MSLDLDLELLAKLAAGAITLAAALLKLRSDRGSRLVTYVSHATAFPLGEQGQVHVHSIVLSNTGKRTAFNVRVPDLVPRERLNITVFPAASYRFESSPEGTFEIIFPTVVPNEKITISYIYQQDLLWSQISWPPKSDDGQAEVIRLIPAHKPSPVLRKVTWGLALLGVAVLAYIIALAALNSAA